MVVIKYSLYARNILANNIVFFRIKFNLSQEELAHKLGTTTTYLSNLENAKRNIRIDYIGHIADTLGITIDQLFIKRETITNRRVTKKKD